MKPLQIVLLCNVGASSAFMVTRIRQAFLEKEIPIEISSQAFSGTTDLKDIDLVLVAPQLKFMEEEVKTLCSRFDKPHHFVSQSFYGFKEDFDITKEILNALEENNSKE